MTEHSALTGLGADDHTQYQKESEKGAANGYASLGPDAKLPASQIPALALSEFLGTVSSEAAMLALVGQRGDWCTRTDFPNARAFILESDDPTLAANWTDITTAGAVISVNGETGAVVIPSDPASEVAGLRTLGIGASQAAAGNDARIIGAQQTSEKNIAGGYAGLSAAGFVVPARLGSGTADSTKYLAGDSTWQTLPASSLSVIRVEDEGTTEVTEVVSLNFVGAGVDVADAGGGEATITVPATISPGGEHPDLAEHDSLGLATQGELNHARNVLEHGVYGHGVVVSGNNCAVTAQPTPDMTVAVESGTIWRNGVTTAVPGNNVGIGAAHATLPRIDTVAVDSAGTASVVPGVAAANPVPDFGDPWASTALIPLATVYVAPDTTAITAAMITDERLAVPGVEVGEVQVARRTTDLSKTSNATSADDPVLTLPVSGTGVYELDAVLLYTGAQAGDIKARITAPAGTNTGTWLSFDGILVGVTGTALPIAMNLLAVVGINTDVGAGALSTTAWARMTIRGFVDCTTAADGNVAVAWAQNTSSTTATTLRAGSFLKLRRIS